MAGHKNNTRLLQREKPSFPKELFWEWDLSKVDWQKHYLAVIDRIIPRGNSQDWKELVRYYGEPKVSNALTSEIKYLPDYIIDDVCSYFKLRKEELACCARNQWRKGHWI